jgi:putative component of membrane protein insertase Oxa1/YidC/SpoIIIJ protein YidD
MSSFLNLLSQPFVLSTTHRLFGSGFSPRSTASCLVLFSSHLDLMCALYPYCSQRSSDGLPKYPLSKQRFSSISRGISDTILRIRSSPSTGESCLFAPVTHIDRGIPFPSHLRCLLVQFFPPVRWIWSNRFCSKRGFH